MGNSKKSEEFDVIGDGAVYGMTIAPTVTKVIRRPGGLVRNWQLEQWHYSPTLYVLSVTFEKIFNIQISYNFKKNIRIFKNYFEKFGRIISRNSLEIVEKYFGSSRELFRKISVNFQKYFWKFQEILTKFLRITLKKFFLFRKLQGLLRRILRFFS